MRSTIEASVGIYPFDVQDKLDRLADTFEASLKRYI